MSSMWRPQKRRRLRRRRQHDFPGQKRPFLVASSAAARPEGTNMKNANMLTVFIRKRSSGHRLCAFMMTDMNHAYSIATTLMASPSYARCYAVAVDFLGNE